MRRASSIRIRYSIVIPFYNEQENVSPLYIKLTEVMQALGEPYELVFVDDGSRDSTFKVLSDIYEHDPLRESGAAASEFRSDRRAQGRI